MRFAALLLAFATNQAPAAESQPAYLASAILSLDTFDVCDLWHGEAEELFRRDLPAGVPVSLDAACGVSSAGVPRFILQFLIEPADAEQTRLAEAFVAEHPLYDFHDVTIPLEKIEAYTASARFSGWRLNGLEDPVPTGKDEGFRTFQSLPEFRRWGEKTYARFFDSDIPAVIRTLDYLTDPAISREWQHRVLVMSNWVELTAVLIAVTPSKSAEVARVYAAADCKRLPGGTCLPPAP